jgi:hypothetical protein
VCGRQWQYAERKNAFLLQQLYGRRKPRFLIYCRNDQGELMLVYPPGHRPFRREGGIARLGGRAGPIERLETNSVRRIVVNTDVQDVEVHQFAQFPRQDFEEFFRTAIRNESL